MPSVMSFGRLLLRSEPADGLFPLPHFGETDFAVVLDSCCEIPKRYSSTDTPHIASGRCSSISSTLPSALSPENYVEEQDGSITELKLPQIPPDASPIYTPRRPTLYGMRVRKIGQGHIKRGSLDDAPIGDSFNHAENHRGFSDSSAVSPTKSRSPSDSFSDSSPIMSIERAHNTIACDKPPATPTESSRPPYIPTTSTQAEIIELYFQLGMTKCTPETLAQRQYVAKLTNISLNKLGVRLLGLVSWS
jgi:hypothetical protein